MKLLLFSNSTNYGEEYLAYTKTYLKNFLGEKLKQSLFIPYAGVSISYDDYSNRVNAVFAELGHELNSIHDAKNASLAIENAEAIVIGGGNTFHLTHMLHKIGIIEDIQKKVKTGTPYIGWSAGSVVACPTLKTTNDMPIVEPKSFETLGLVPFQINPHYTDATIPNHGGETREDRIKEFLIVNPLIKVIGLKEGTMLHIENRKATLLGNKTLKVFAYNKPSLEFDETANLDFLFQ